MNNVRNLQTRFLLQTVIVFLFLFNCRKIALIELSRAEEVNMFCFIVTNKCRYSLAVTVLQCQFDPLPVLPKYLPVGAASAWASIITE